MWYLVGIKGFCFFKDIFDVLNMNEMNNGGGGGGHWTDNVNVSHQLYSPRSHVLFALVSIITEVIFLLRPNFISYLSDSGFKNPRLNKSYF